METEKRLIDANELIRFLENERDKISASYNREDRALAHAMKLVAKNIRVFPSVDAVEVVRCKDCWLGENCTCVCCEDGEMVLCRNLYKHMPADGFCSDGWRQDNG